MYLPTWKIHSDETLRAGLLALPTFMVPLKSSTSKPLRNWRLLYVSASI